MTDISSNKGKIRLKSLSDLLPTPTTNESTRISPKLQTSTYRTRLRIKQELQLENEDVLLVEAPQTKKLKNEKENQSNAPSSTVKKKSKTELEFTTPALKKLSRNAKTTSKKLQMTANQKRIDTFFTTGTKNQKAQPKTPKEQPKNARGRKRLFAENTVKRKSPMRACKAQKSQLNKSDKQAESVAVIDLCAQSETDDNDSDLDDFDLSTSKMYKMSRYTRKSSTAKSPTVAEAQNLNKMQSAPALSEKKKSTVAKEPVQAQQSVESDVKSKPFPAYKVIEGTNFAVDAFRYGAIPNVSYYFLTHFHADHYIGLTRKFSAPLFLSPITASLVTEFVGVDGKYLHEIELNDPIELEGIEVTALDANHCPGAIMLIFKFPTGKCILHTGDFRASSEMESEPFFWNNEIHTIYLDTTYLPTQYAFCTQHESIDRGKYAVDNFRNRYPNKRILYVCGSYVIGKEKFWSAIALEYNMRVWTEANRRKALKVMQLPELKHMQYVESPEDADMHILPLGKLNYPTLHAYFQNFKHLYDVMLAFRPSGWEKNSRPRFSGQVNVVGIEYSEHSSFLELERFIKFLKPQKVISTVPVGRNLNETSDVPLRWYQYDKLTPKQINCQPTITNYLTPMQNKKKPGISKSDPRFVNSSPNKSTPLGCVGSVFEEMSEDRDDS